MAAEQVHSAQQLLTQNARTKDKEHVSAKSEVRLSARRLETRDEIFYFQLLVLTPRGVRFLLCTFYLLSFSHIENNNRGKDDIIFDLGILAQNGCYTSSESWSSEFLQVAVD